MYNYNALDGCHYAAYDARGNCLHDTTFEANPEPSTRGGGFVVGRDMAVIKFSTNVTLLRTVTLTVAEFIDGVSDVDDLYERLDAYCVDEQYTQGIVNLYLDAKDASAGQPDDDPADTPGGLPAPDKAAVDQFIVVAAVDANGAVTATKCVTLQRAEEVAFGG